MTASADKSIKLWKSGVAINTLTGHTDTVRGLAVISRSEFISTSNDATVRRWNSSGDCLGTYHGQENIHRISLLDGSRWVTSGEDQFLRIWVDNEVVQTISLPAISVSVAVLASGDIAAATNDGCVRTFSSDPSRQASNDCSGAILNEWSDSGERFEQQRSGRPANNRDKEELRYVGIVLLVDNCKISLL